MLPQAAQAAVEATRTIPWLDVGVIAVAIKVIDSLGSAGIRAWQARSKAREVSAQAELEEAKAYQIALRGKNGESKPSLIAFCPSHIGIVEAITELRTDVKHINADLKEIKEDVKIIRGAMGK